LNETVDRRPAQTSRQMNETPVQSPGLGKSMAQAAVVSLSPPLAYEGLCARLFRCIWEFGRGRMRAGQRHENMFTERGKSRQFGGNPSGFWVTYSDTIEADSRLPFIPLWEGRRRTEHAVQWSTTIPCSLHPQSAPYLGFWKQPVAAVNEERLRQLRSKNARPEKVGGKVTSYRQDSFSLRVFSAGLPKSQDAASMANLEVSKCR